MARVHVIKSQKQIDQVRNLIQSEKGDQYARLWTYGVNMGLTVVEALATPMDGAVKALATGEYVIERKGNTITLSVNEASKYVIRAILKENPSDQWLFQSHWRNSEHKRQPISRMSVHHVFKSISDSVGFRLGDHSMRKARGAMLFKHGYCMEAISKMLGHSMVYETYRYLETPSPTQSFDQVNL